MDVRGIICIALTIYWVILIVRILSSWFPPPAPGPLRTIMDFLHAVTDPVLRPIRGMVPPVRMGMMALDLSPIIVFVIIAVLQRVICG
jgi:YggT family protein